MHMTQARVAGPPFAAAMIDEVWSAEAVPGGIVLPDGSSDLIFDEHGWARVCGVMSRARRVTASSSRPMFGVRLAPWAAYAVLGVAADELRDGLIPIGEVDRSLASALAGVASAGELARRLPAILAAGRERRPVDQRVRRAAAMLVGVSGTGTLGDIRIDGVARAVDLSERQLERLVRQHVGLSPKRLARIARLRAALSSARAGALAEVAAAAGYADQAHFARDVRALTGVTARELVGR
jgi:AraC-like DNA-binding protein